MGTPAVLESVGVTADAAMTKMRLMALLVLGSKAAGSPVSFADIKTALDITPEQVGLQLYQTCTQPPDCAAAAVDALYR